VVFAAAHTDLGLSRGGRVYSEELREIVAAVQELLCWCIMTATGVEEGRGRDGERCLGS
jgi:hypothetical protein